MQQTESGDPTDSGASGTGSCTAGAAGASVCTQAQAGYFTTDGEGNAVSTAAGRGGMRLRVLSSTAGATMPAHWLGLAISQPMVQVQA